MTTETENQPKITAGLNGVLIEIEHCQEEFTKLAARLDGVLTPVQPTPPAGATEASMEAASDMFRSLLEAHVRLRTLGDEIKVIRDRLEC